MSESNLEAVGQINSNEKVEVSSSRKSLRFIMRIFVTLVLLSLIAIFSIWESRNSRIQSKMFSYASEKLSYSIEPGSSPNIRFPSLGPYDLRLGYSHLQKFSDRLTANGYRIETQSRFSPLLYDITKLGIFTTYHEKTKAGIQILDRDNKVIFASYYPKRVYKDFDSIPKLVVDTLLFIENRELLNEKHPYRNPAIEWDRLGKALFDNALNKIYKGHSVTGGSTLATQIEKYRHSPEGRTSTGLEKIRQMTSASLRAYLNGEKTLDSQRQIVLNYVNSIPLAAIPGYGEVNSLGDGLWAWYGADFDFVNSCLEIGTNDLNDPDMALKVKAYKQVLSLFIAHRRPSDYLIENRALLEDTTNNYLQILAKNDVISKEIKAAALKVNLIPRQSVSVKPLVPFIDLKAANSIRTHLFILLGVPQLYELDRLDLTVKSTLDRDTQDAIIGILHKIKERDEAQSVGLTGYRLLGDQDLSKVIYSFTLYEHVGNANLLRVQADSLDQPLNINEGAKLELGSTAKLRTLVSYLEIIAELHEKYANLSNADLVKIPVSSSDNLSRWVINYLLNTSDRKLLSIMQAAMQRRYSASPGEAFFTGGGRHRFSNFEGKHNGQVMTVEDALENSVNLVFIRMMRDIVNYYMYQVPGSTAKIMDDKEEPLRQVYLSRFADREGKVFLRKFYNKYNGKKPDEAMELLLQGVHPIPSRLATVYRSVIPDAGMGEFASFMRSRLPISRLDSDDISYLYNYYSKSTFNLADRGYIARIHPLELWVVGYLRQHPEAKEREMMEASTQERQDVYDWLFKTRHKHAQDIRIRTLLEIEAFQAIHESWQRVGYPFSSLVPSLATAIGSSADRPAALAELVGVILNDGVRYPTMRVEELHFAKDTPYETAFRREVKEGEQVIAPEIAQVIKKALVGVIEEGTGRRLYKAFSKPDKDYIVVGGKTGTGDNRRDIFSSRGRLIESKVINRTATLVFFIGDRFYGTITAYVDGPDAARFKFTSSLPVQMMKILAPELMPLVSSEPKEIIPAVNEEPNLAVKNN